MSMVKTTRGVDARWDAVLLEQVSDALCEFRGSWRRIINLISLFREAIIVVKHRRISRSKQGGLLFFPMRANHHNSIRPMKLAG